MTVYLLTRRLTLHSANKVNGEIQTFEGDNLDDTEGMELYENEMNARRAAKRLCRRCFPGDVRRV